MEQLPLFSQPAPIDTNEQERKQAAILAYYLKGGTLTVLQALKRFKTTELRKVNCRLKNKGHVIVSVWHEENGKRKFKVYKLVKDGSASVD